MYKNIFIALLTLLLVFSASAFVWQTYSSTFARQNTTDASHGTDSLSVSKVDISWQQGSKAVDLDQYIASNQVSQNIIDKKQRVMLEPELINFHAALQAPVTNSNATLVADALAVWGISPLPDVGFSTYIRSPEGQVIAVYVEDKVAEHIAKHYQPKAVLAFQAYRLYNYANGPRLLLVGVKPSNKAITAALTSSKNTDSKSVNSNTEASGK